MFTEGKIINITLSQSLLRKKTFFLGGFRKNHYLCGEFTFKSISKGMKQGNQVSHQVAEAVVEWRDTGERFTALISLDDVWVDDMDPPYRLTSLGPIPEDKIFFHAGSVEGLRRLQASDDEEFKILEVCGFY